MGLSSAGIGSNLPIDSIIQQLMTLEQRPLTLLDKKVATFQSKLSAMGTLKGALSTFQSAVRGLSELRKFQAMGVSVGDPAVATVSAGSAAATGTYSLEVAKLAQAQKLAAVGQASSSAAIGAGTISFDMGTISDGTFDAASGKYDGAKFTSAGAGLKSVTIDPANTSLSGIRDAINKAGIGVSASIVSDGSAAPYRLLLTQASTGKANSMSISVAGSPELTALLKHDPRDLTTQALQQTVAAQNAEFKLDGLLISTASNIASNVIEGVTLNLAKTNVGSPTNVVVARDSAAVIDSVGKFVSAYNAVTKTLKDLTAYNEATKTGAVLNGDATARSIATQLRALMTTPVANGGSAFSVLSEIGVTVKAGVMAVDDAKLKKAVETNFDDIATLFAAVGKPTDSLVSFKSATDKTQPGAYAIQIDQLARRGATVGGQIANLASAGGKSLQVTLDGVTAGVTLGPGPYLSTAALAVELQSKINSVLAFSSAGAAVTVTETGDKLTLTSNRYGAVSNLSVAPGDGFDALLGAGTSASAGVDVAGKIGDQPATGVGRTLTGAAGNPAEGLALLIDGAGARGVVNYSQGYAAQFDKFTSALLDTTGPLTLRTEGISKSIKQLGESRLRLSDRLADVEKRYRAQYSALDATMSRMSTTSAYLTQQLAQLSKL